MIKVNLVSKLNFVLFMHFESMGNQAKLECFGNHTSDPPCRSEFDNENVHLNNPSNSCNYAGGLTDARDDVPQV